MYQKKKQTMKKITIVLASLLILLIVNPANIFAGDNKTEKNKKAEISGQVIDQKTGESLAGVLVQLEGTDLKTYTDFEGNFSFENIAPGNYAVNVSMISYNNDEVKNIEVKTGESKSLNIQILQY